MRIFLIFTACFLWITSLAQEQIKPEKSSFTDGKYYYQHVDLPVYLFISHSLDGKGTALREERGTEVNPILLDGHGVHHIRHMDDIHKRVDVYKIHADGHAPVSTLKLSPNSSTYRNKSGTMYYGLDFACNIFSKDEMSGVSKIFLSLDGENYSEINETFALDKHGEHILLYYATDKVGNIEAPKRYKIFIDARPPKTFHNFIGVAMGQVLSSSSHIYLTAEDENSGVAATYYAFDDESEKLYNGKEINFAHLETGEHLLHYWSIDNTGNRETKQTVDFFLDKIAPIASIDILGDKFVVDDKIYLSGRTKVKITAIDNRTGIKYLKYSINNKAPEKYLEPFYMPDKAGLYTIQYYATDEADNTGSGEILQSKGVIYVDLLGPAIQFKCEGPSFEKKDRIYISRNTKLIISGKDNESGLNRLAYTIDGGEEQEYLHPFKIEQPTKGNDAYEVICIAYDNVNNRNEKKLNLYIDSEGPEITTRYSAEPDGILYPSYVAIFLAATDSTTTVSQILYSINGAAEIPYSSPIKGFRPKKEYNIKVKAKDAVGNETVKEFNFQTGDF
ncbi:MAG: hypothetical protein LBC98_00410 [Prevotellaceae bacterium]|jgi:hypothetical protein|nr:hypothetical protein [Prevotellaceae bacterium]